MTWTKMIMSVKGSIQGFEAIDVDNNVVKLRTAIVPMYGGIGWGPSPVIDRVILETIEELDDGTVRYTQWGLPR